MSLNLQPTEEWQDIFWGYNLPLQMWQSEGGHRPLVYMPRKEVVKSLEVVITPEELPKFCQNTAVILRNLADLFEALGEGKIKTIYYPDQTVAEAIKSREEDEEDTPEEDPQCSSS